MKPHARFVPIEEIRAAASAEKKRKPYKPTNENTASSFCFPSIESLLSKENNINPMLQQSTKMSPYEISDNQFIFDNQNLAKRRSIRTATISPRSSKSPPPRHVMQMQDSGPAVSIDNYNPEKYSPFTEQLTLDAIAALSISQEDLFYQPYSSTESREKVRKNIINVKKERQKIAFKAGKVIPYKHTRNLSPPVRGPVDITETFANDSRNQLMVIPHKNIERNQTPSSGQRVQTAEFRRSIKARKLVL